MQIHSKTYANGIRKAFCWRAVRIRRDAAGKKFSIHFRPTTRHTSRNRYTRDEGAQFSPPASPTSARSSVLSPHRSPPLTKSDGQSAVTPGTAAPALGGSLDAGGRHASSLRLSPLPPLSVAVLISALSCRQRTCWRANWRRKTASQLHSAGSSMQFVELYSKSPPLQAIYISDTALFIQWSVVDREVSREAAYRNTVGDLRLWTKPSHFPLLSSLQIFAVSIRITASHRKTLCCHVINSMTQLWSSNLTKTTNIMLYLVLFTLKGCLYRMLLARQASRLSHLVKPARRAELSGLHNNKVT